MISRKIFAAAGLLAVSAFTFAQNAVSGSSAPDYKVQYIKGNLTQKTQSLYQAQAFEDYDLILNAMDFALEVQPLLGDDAELNSFVETAVMCLKNSADLNSEDISLKLGNVFRTFTSEKIKIATLDKLKDFPSASNTTLVNNFVNEKIQAGAPMDNVLLKAIQTLKFIGNSNSFNLLFVADVLDIWPQYSQMLEDSFSPYINYCEREILALQSGATDPQKIRIIEILSKIEGVSVKIRGETAENMLSAAINNAGDLQNVSSDQIQLQLKALDVLSETQWTRSASMVTDFFTVAQKEYDSTLISEEDFAAVIQKITAFGSTDTVLVLSNYLDNLNKGMESGNAPVKGVVLSVINALGALGDKSAFDCLLYVTYLSYPEEVVFAARNALSKLKW